MVVMALIAQGTPTHAQGTDASLSAIVAQLRSGNNQQALDLARSQARLHPRDCRLPSLEGIALTGMHREEEALAAFDRALSVCTTYIPALEGAAQIRYKRKEKQSIPMLERITTLEPANLPAQAMLASALRNSGDCQAALPHFALSRPAFENKPEWMEGEAACLAANGDDGGALALYRALQSTQPNDGYVYDIAYLEWKMGAKAQALETLEALLTAGVYAPALSLGSQLCEEQGNTPRAVELSRKAILADPDNVRNYLEFANIAFTHNSFDVGIQMVDVGLKRIPDSAELYLARGVLKAQVTDRVQAAVADFEQAHRLDPKLSLSVDAIGIAKSQLHEDADSIRLFEEQAKRNPDDPVLHYLLAEQLSQKEGADKETLEQAIAAAERAIALDPHYQPAHDLLAKLYVRADQPRLAIEQALIALAIDPNDQEALYQQMMATRRTGDRAAIQELSRRFDAMRKANTERRQRSDRFHLEEAKP